MIQPRSDSAPVFLLGMMGAGKSTVGRLLAERRGAVFIDLDRRVELMFGDSISGLFSHSEAYFRACERSALLALLDEPGFTRSRAVVGTGGGVVTNPANLSAMGEVAVTIHLEVDTETLVRRLSDPAQRQARPLLAEGDMPARLQRLLDDRSEAYAQAHFTVDARLQPVRVAEQCVAALLPPPG